MVEPLRKFLKGSKVYFVPDLYRSRVPDDIWNKGENVTLDAGPTEGSAPYWPTGDRPQGIVLCVCKSDGTAYRVFKDRKDVPDDYMVLGQECAWAGSRGTPFSVAIPAHWYCAFAVQK